MEEIKIKIGDKKYKVWLSQTEAEQEKGLSDITELPEDKGMLFSFDDTEEVSIWMKDTHIALDIVFIDLDMIVKAVYQGVPESEELMTENDVAFVLEVNVNSGIKVGDELEFSPDTKVKSDKMTVLNADGSSQIDLEGGERIFSRNSTKVLIRKAKKASTFNRESDFKALGRYIFKELEAQDNREPEYVESKK